MKKIVFPLVVAGVLAGGAWAVRTLPWWGLVLMAVGLIVAGKFTAKKLLRTLFLTPFKMKGAVLRGATAQVHSVTPTVAPTKTDADADVEPENPAVPRRYFTLDVTIQPREATGKFTYWEPGELRLSRPEFRIDPNSGEGSSEDDACHVAELQYEEDGSFKKDEGFKFAGPKKLKMTLAVREGVDSLKFNYYFEEFGAFQLPSASLRAAA